MGKQQPVGTVGEALRSSKAKLLLLLHVQAGLGVDVVSQSCRGRLQEQYGSGLLQFAVHTPSDWYLSFTSFVRFYLHLAAFLFPVWCSLHCLLSFLWREQIMPPYSKMMDWVKGAWTKWGLCSMTDGTIHYFSRDLYSMFFFFLHIRGLRHRERGSVLMMLV